MLNVTARCEWKTSVCAFCCQVTFLGEGQGTEEDENIFKEELGCWKGSPWRVKIKKPFGSFQALNYSGAPEPVKSLKFSHHGLVSEVPSGTCKDSRAEVGTVPMPLKHPL